MSLTNGSMMDDLRYRFRYGGMITKLIMVNVAVFLVVKVAILIDFLVTGNSILVDGYLHYLMVPADLGTLGRQFWSPVTHMFLHTGLLHILFNMLWLYWFGILFKDYVGESRVLPVYLLGGLAGAFLMILTYNIFPGLPAPGTYALGASGAVMAIVVATAAMVPEHTIHLLFFGPVRLKWIAVTVVVIDLISIPAGNTGGHIAHLGGALFGLLFTLRLKEGSDWSKPFYSIGDGIRNFFDFSTAKKSGKRKSKVRMAYRSDKQSESPQNQTRQKDARRDKQERIDEILDKIGRSGYESLSKEEKAFLFRMSKE